MASLEAKVPKEAANETVAQDAFRLTPQMEMKMKAMAMS